MPIRDLSLRRGNYSKNSFPGAYETPGLAPGRFILYVFDFATQSLEIYKNPMAEYIHHIKAMSPDGKSIFANDLKGSMFELY